MLCALDGEEQDDDDDDDDDDEDHLKLHLSNLQLPILGKDLKRRCWR